VNKAIYVVIRNTLLSKRTLSLFTDIRQFKVSKGWSSSKLHGIYAYENIRTKIILRTKYGDSTKLIRKFGLTYWQTDKWNDRINGWFLNSLSTKYIRIFKESILMLDHKIRIFFIIFHKRQKIKRKNTQFYILHLTLISSMLCNENMT